MHYVSYPELLPESMSAGQSVLVSIHSVSFLGMDVTLIEALMLGDALGVDGKSCISVYVPTRFSWLHVCAGCQHIDGVPRWTERPVPSLVAPRSRHLQVILKWMLYLAYVHCVLWSKQLSNKSNSVSNKRVF